jgi:hypothetical protein
MEKIEIYMKTIHNNPRLRELTKPLQCPLFNDEIIIQIPIGFKWNGASIGPFDFIFHRWKFPIETCRHDFLCELAKNKNERLYADKLFKKDILEISKSKLDSIIGYIFVRIGAFFNIGNEF